LLLDVGDKSGEGDTAYVSNSNFLWENVDNYIRQQEAVSAVSWPQDSAEGQSNAIEIFEQFFGKYFVQKIMAVTNHYAEQFKNSGAILMFNLLKAKRRLLYLKPQSVPRSKHFSSRL